MREASCARDQEDTMRIDYLHAPTWGRGGIGPRRGVKKLPCSLPFVRQAVPLCWLPSTRCTSIFPNQYTE